MTDTMTAPCALDSEWLGNWGEQPSGTACGESSFATISLACVHEHLETMRICWGCAADTQQAKGMLTCPRCWTASPGRHACYMLVVIDWDSGERTIAQRQDVPRT